LRRSPPERGSRTPCCDTISYDRSIEWADRRRPCSLGVQLATRPDGCSLDSRSVARLPGRCRFSLGKIAVKGLRGAKRRDAKAAGRSALDSGLSRRQDRPARGGRSIRLWGHPRSCPQQHGCFPDPCHRHQRHRGPDRARRPRGRNGLRVKGSPRSRIPQWKPSGPSRSWATGTGTLV